MYFDRSSSLESWLATPTAREASGTHTVGPE
jgi:hypothetical protein